VAEVDLTALFSRKNFSDTLISASLMNVPQVLIRTVNARTQEDRKALPAGSVEWTSED